VIENHGQKTATESCAQRERVVLVRTDAIRLIATVGIRSERIRASFILQKERLNADRELADHTGSFSFTISMCGHKPV